MRYLTLSIFIFVVTFGMPLFANAVECSSSTLGQSCIFGGAAGTCTQGDEGIYCKTSNSTPSGGTTNPVTPSGGVGGKNITLINPLGAGANLFTLLDKILGFVITIGSIVIILMLVYVGFLFVKARGEPGKITEARQALLWTVIGALVLLGSKAISLGITATVQALATGN